MTPIAIARKDKFKRVGPGEFVVTYSINFTNFDKPAGFYVVIYAGSAADESAHSRALQFAELLKGEVQTVFPGAFSPSKPPASGIATEYGKVFGYCQMPPADFSTCFNRAQIIEENLRAAVNQVMAVKPKPPAPEPAPLAPGMVRLVFTLREVTTGGECLDTAFGQPGDHTIQVTLPVDTLGIEPPYTANNILSRLLGQFAQGGVRLVLVPVSPASDAGQQELEEG